MARTATQPKSVPGVYTNQQIIEAATGRWGEIVHDIKFAEPYVIQKPEGGEIVVAPLTRRRRKALKAAQAAYVMLGAQLAQVQNDNTADVGTIDRINKLIDEADDQYSAALFGDAWEEVEAFYEDQPEELWNAMYQDVHDKLVNRVELPEDTCSKCGRPFEDGEGEGKDESSSTSPNGTGTKSKATSGTTSTA